MALALFNGAFAIESDGSQSGRKYTVKDPLVSPSMATGDRGGWMVDYAVVVDGDERGVAAGGQPF